ncbi:cache domain-containing sensor histidine kinase [Metabacillus halosaccharovorans]|uniref:histidine kinase n=1 Tax=Metabacillus halosaccharovorans TaxID=930124 RepID=A0ABT3DH89_9BACI|nr:sensor histidine kinase [Metabacillus halosaccharovorans]MCV9886424.1 sensor histidine kinase [Metabacillus halosaccharovorans]
MKQRFYKLNNLSIKHKVIALLLVISIVPSIGLGLLTGYTVERILEKQAADHTLQLIGQVNKTLESYMNNMQNVSYLLSMDPEIERFLTTPTQPNTEDGRYSIKQFMQGLSTLYPEIAGILVVNSNGQFISNELYPKSDKNLSKESWYKEAVENEGIFTIVGHPKDRNITSHINYEDDEVVTVVRAILEPETQKVMGVVLIDLKLRVIAEATKNIRLGKSGYLMVIDQNGESIYTPANPLVVNPPTRLLEEEDSGYFSETIDDQGFQFIYQKLPFTNWTTVGIFSTDESVYEVRTIHFYVICFVFFVCLFGITASYYLSNSMSKPIFQLMSSMKEVESGNLSIQYESGRQDEIGMLGKSFNHMIMKINELLLLTEKQERQKREAELRSLQAHIKPHFLYNTLDTISWMARKRGAEDVSDVVTALSRLFRIGLNKGHDIIYLKEEITHIQSYLSIQKARYRDKLKYSIDVKEAFQDVQILKLILQPIVENAIYHGIKERKGPGHIAITAKEVDECLLLTVSDDGKGIPKDKLTMLNERLDSLYKEQDQKVNFGYGMMNVQARIKLTYGENYGLQIDSLPDVGTTVTIRLPIHRK